MIPVRSYLNLLRRYLRRQRGRVALLAAFLFGGIALQVANPQLVRVFIDRAIAGGPVSALLPLAVAFLVVAGVQQVLAVGATWSAEHIGWTATNELREDLTDHLLHLDMGFHKRHAPGEIVDRIDGDVTALANFFGQFSVQVVGNAALVAGVLVLMTWVSPPIGLITSVLALSAFLGMSGMHRLSAEWWRQEKETRARYYGFVGEAVAAAEDVHGNGAGPFVRRYAGTIMREWLPRSVRGWHGWSVMWGTSIAYYAISTAIIFALSAWLFARGSLTLGAAYLVFFYSEMIRHPLERIRTQMADMQKAGAGITRIRELLAETPDLTDTGTQALPEGALAVEFDGVDFSYEDDADGDGGRVLHGVTMRLGAGRVLGVLGRTGSGKTTLARLLTRLYDPEAGEVRLGGVPVVDVPLRALRGRVGMVTQDVQLFRATIRDNLTFFDRSVSDDEVWGALQRLGIADWVRAQPDGLDTTLDAGGGGLSAGEAQLLAFTRIFLEDSGLVILDEASSRLDPATEQLIDTAMHELLAGRTGVIIAHRLETVERADDVVILDGGRVVEHGERAELAAHPGSRLAALLRTGIEEVLA